MKKFDNYKQNIYNTRISVTPQASLYSSLFSRFKKTKKNALKMQKNA